MQKAHTAKLMTLDDLFDMEQTQIDENFWNSVALTPRSSEAFRRSGILPCEIIYPTLNMFV